MEGKGGGYVIDLPHPSSSLLSGQSSKLSHRSEENVVHVPSSHWYPEQD